MKKLLIQKPLEALALGAILVHGIPSFNQPSRNSTYASRQDVSKYILVGLSEKAKQKVEDYLSKIERKHKIRDIVVCGNTCKDIKGLCKFNKKHLPAEVVKRYGHYFILGVDEDSIEETLSKGLANICYYRLPTQERKSTSPERFVEEFAKEFRKRGK